MKIDIAELDVSLCASCECHYPDCPQGIIDIDYCGGLRPYGSYCCEYYEPIQPKEHEVVE